MVINIDNLKSNLKELNTLINNYETNYYNLYNELSSCSNHWSDKKAELFFYDVDLEKIKVSNSVAELKQLYSLYDYLINKYEHIGTNIKIDLAMRDSILSEFDKFLDMIYNLLEQFRKIDFSNVDININDINFNIDKLIYISNLLVSLKARIKKHFNLCDETEKAVSLKISKINIEILKETDIKKYI